ncbi:restriction endonuclease subunit S [Micromonospora sp. NBC_01739]|uniref:restriction endonuclease subunit S n=1 Tax=Micromonospora sp. NBC_01739 TaxID=2975985 RepID=UPI002E11A22A|nr:restriction endonuclease subunit S [Micromonospora sp. NBC_01739]
MVEFFAGSSLPEGEPYGGQDGGYFLLKVSDMNLPGNEVTITHAKEWSTSPGARSATCPAGSIVIPKRGGAIATNKKRLITRPSVLDPNLMAAWPHPDVVDLRFLHQWFLTFDLASIASGSSIPQLNKRDLSPLPFPLPPIEEQHRIAEVLDRADELRAKRREALAQLDDLALGIFLETFGSPDTNPQGWPLIRLADVLAIPLRNGISPATRGEVEAEVLTLSSITGRRFDPMAKKTSTFLAPHSATQVVHPSDFLICRGNGNLGLVGRGFFPSEAMPDTAFPDTIIAARVERVCCTDR